MADRIAEALETLNDLLANGREWPDAVWTTTQRHSVTSQELEEAHDAQER